MRDRRISSVLVTGERGLEGIPTIRDVSGRVMAEGVDPASPAATAMTCHPVMPPPDAIGSGVLHLMKERGIGPVPIADGGGLVGNVTQTTLARFQADGAAQPVGVAAEAPDADGLAAVTARILRPRSSSQAGATGTRWSRGSSPTWPTPRPAGCQRPTRRRTGFRRCPVRGSPAARGAGASRPAWRTGTTA